MASPQRGDEAYAALTAKPPDKQKVYYLLEDGLDPNEWRHPETGDTLMHVTARRFSHSLHEVLEKLVEHGATIDPLNNVCILPARHSNYIRFRNLFN